MSENSRHKHMRVEEDDSPRRGAHFSSPAPSDPADASTSDANDSRTAPSPFEVISAGNSPAGKDVSSSLSDGVATPYTGGFSAKDPSDKDPYDDGTSEKKPGKRGGKSNLVSNILIIVGVVLLLVAGGMWGFAQWRYHQQDVQNKKLATYATLPDDGKKAPTVDWTGLKAVNEDVVGWIQVPGTVINYPVYQGVDNDQYLRTTAEGEYSVGGQIFLDYENTKPGMVDQQSILYGHHLKDGSMFYPLFLLKDQETFDATDTIWYVTEAADYELEPLFVYFTDPEDMDVRTFKFASDEAFHKYLTERLGRAVSRRSDAEQIIAGAKHVLTMSTCNYYEGYGRSILVSVPKSEATAVLTGTATTAPATSAAAGTNATAGTNDAAETEGTAEADGTADTEAPEEDAEETE